MRKFSREPKFCQRCGHFMDCTIGERAPMDGDYGLCGGCGLVSVRKGECWKDAERADIVAMPIEMKVRVLLYVAIASQSQKSRETLH
jgi:hypothetical protein